MQDSEQTPLHTQAHTQAQAQAHSHLLALFTAQRHASRADPAPTAAVRRDRLRRLLAMVTQHQAEICNAIDADFGGRSQHETRLTEVLAVQLGIRHALRHLERWMAPQRRPTALHFWPARNELLRQPLGVVGVVSPWNYPCMLALGPATGALAAGNRVMFKPSELTPVLSSLLLRMTAQHFAPEELCGLAGDTALAQAFCNLPFDHLFFTGSSAVGRQVAQAAGRNLTPVTLELGGKSPAILDASCDLALASKRLAVGKLLNAGQTCVAPDYLLVPRGRSRAVAQALQQAMTRLYPSWHDNADYTAIISERHLSRLQVLLEDARTQGGEVLVVNPAPAQLAERVDQRPDRSVNKPTRKLAPALVLGAHRGMRLMQEEIFGPILPLVEYDTPDDAIAFVATGERPLALYWFGRDAAVRERVLSRSLSGGVTVNDCIWHLAQEDQPFGGVGASGQGSYHGEWGFRTFSHEKPVFHQSRYNAMPWLHPPYGRSFERLMALMQRMR